MHDHMPQTLCINDEACTFLQRHPTFCRGVRQPVCIVVHQQHVAVWTISELNPRSNNPTLTFRIETIVVITMQRSDSGLSILRLQLDDCLLYTSPSPRD